MDEKEKALKETEDLLAAELKAKQAAEAVEKQRVDNLVHQQTIWEDAHMSMIDNCIDLSPNQVTVVVNAIMNGKIKHITLNY